jgi:arylsulfatase A-like enzyme/HEAT repeat protein
MMKWRGLLQALFGAVLLSAATAADPRPNVLWITAEDICPNLGCYGDPDAVTPNLDRFATAAVRYTQVFSVHPCCSPSRSCLATGVYPTRLGTFQHRGKTTVNPDLVQCFPTLLRAAGYYTFNGMKGGTAKLDYNFEPRDQPWDKVGSRQIEWRARLPGQPFFGQVNLACTHQSQYGQATGVQRGQPLPEWARVHDPSKVRVPPYHPDTPAVREIWRQYHNRVTQMDGEFAALLAQLDADGLADDTVVFFFGDNGHGIPGGKIWLWDQGPHVPLLIRVPPKWQRVAAAPPGSVSDRLVSFLDFAPTVLSLCGVPVPASMQGAAFFGPAAGAPRAYVYAARDFHENADFDTSRMVRDRRFHYIRNFMPHLGWDAILYSWESAPFMLESWRQEEAAGRLRSDTRQACFWRKTKPVEELYDMEQDPWQMHNLAGLPQHQPTLERLRAECERWMTENRDLGLLSQYEFYTRAAADTPLQMGADPQRNPVGRLLAAANLANRATPESLPALLDLLRDRDAAVRRWGAIGLLALRGRAAPATAALRAALKDSSPDVRGTAAEALFGLGAGDDVLPALVALLSHSSRVIRRETLLAICRIGPPARAALSELDRALADGASPVVWSNDNVKPGVSLARSSLVRPPAESALELPPTTAHPVPANGRLWLAREKYDHPTPAQK